MNKEKLDTGTKVLKLIVLCGLAAATITTALNFFAKSKTVQMLDSRLELSIGQDNVDREGAKVDREASKVRWMRQQAVMERRDEPPTAAELDIISGSVKDLARSEKKLDKRETLQSQRVRAFEEKYQQQFK